MIEFTINPAYIRELHVRKEYNVYIKDGRVPTPEELLLVLKGEGNYTWGTHEDHPEFTKLREQLGADGYIKIERGWWNGDRIEKPFKLNGMKFLPGDQFPCAFALGNTFETAKKHPEYHKDKFD